MKINNEVIIQKEWITKGIYCIAHFLKDSGSFLTLPEFNNKYRMNVNFLTFYGCKMSLNEYIKQTNLTLTDNHTEGIPAVLRCLYSTTKGTRIYYDVLMQDNNTPNACAKWSNKLGKHVEWNKVFIRIHKIQDIKLKWFQIRIVHRIIGTNIVLKEMGITNDVSCNFCLREKDSIDHIFWKCVYVNHFWKKFEELMILRCTTCLNLKLGETLVLFGTDKNVKTDPVFDLILLLGKMYIYKCKFDHNLPHIKAFEKYIQARYRIEKYNATIYGKILDFTIKWQPYLRLILDE
eukprot:TRINITY_DN36_c0_g1_i6.p1 TRINITY_DN36_c0_g1~~TRINITY_DN36_c0_g1_i6.p1  ORF type:complete len:339 (+),score=19.34 TRINITY_DN36_c0_g1_i6:145-1017(+)